MAYENYSSTSITTEIPQRARAIAQSPGVLEELAKATSAYAETAARFITARDDLNDARERWQRLRDEFAKASETEGV